MCSSRIASAGGGSGSSRLRVDGGAGAQQIGELVAVGGDPVGRGLQVAEQQRGLGQQAGERGSRQASAVAGRARRRRRRRRGQRGLRGAPATSRGRRQARGEGGGAAQGRGDRSVRRRRAAERARGRGRWPSAVELDRDRGAAGGAVGHREQSAGPVGVDIASARPDLERAACVARWAEPSGGRSTSTPPAAAEPHPGADLDRPDPRRRPAATAGRRPRRRAPTPRRARQRVSPTATGRHVGEV